MFSKWDDFLQLGALLAKGDHKYKTLIVDTVGNLYQMCEDFVCTRDGMTDPSDEGFGKGFKRVKKEFHRVILKFQQMGMGVVFIAHAKESVEKSKDISGTLRELTLLGPDLPGSGAKVINGMVDNILYFYTGSDGKRWIQTTPTRYVTAGCRGDHKRSLPIEEKIPLDFDVFIDEYDRALAELNKGEEVNE